MGGVLQECLMDVNVIPEKEVNRSLSLPAFIDVSTLPAFTAFHSGSERSFWTELTDRYLQSLSKRMKRVDGIDCLLMETKSTPRLSF